MPTGARLDSLRAFGLLFLLSASGCGASSSGAPEAQTAPDGLACAGRSLESSRPVPELGLLPSGEPVTSGVALHCYADRIEVAAWSPDSSNNSTVAPPHAMELWSAFEASTTLDERWLIVSQFREAERTREP